MLLKTFPIDLTRNNLNRTPLRLGIFLYQDCLEVISFSSVGSRMKTSKLSLFLSPTKIRHFPSLDWKNMQETIWHNLCWISL